MTVRARIVAGALALLFISMSFLPIAVSEDGTGASPPADAAVEGPPLLRLRLGFFDPAREPPPIPAGFTLSESQGCYIVQFDGPVTAERSEWLESLGRVLAYIPDYAFAVKLEDRSVAEARSHPGVRYLGLFEPGYKLDPALAFGREPRELAVSCFEPERIEETAGRLRALGAELLAVDPLGIRVRAPGALAAGFAFLPEVQWVEEFHPPVPTNFNSARICKIRSQNDGAYNWGSGSMWSYNPATGKYEGYAGANFTAAVVDTGVDGNHPAFSNKKVAYYAYGYSNWVDYYGHGTHTSGTVLGNGAYRATDPGTPGRYAGMAPLAGLVGQLMANANYYTWCNDAVRSGAVVSSNSWGGGNWGVYDSSAVSYDFLVRDSDTGRAGNQSISVCFSAGNDGYYGGGTISPPATAKNILCVGASDVSSGNSVASFSSRGPCSDGRIKPDLLAPGAGVTSCWANSARSYGSMSGTSMSCPVVAGAVVLVNEYYNSTRGVLPSPAMVKNLLLNGADVLSGYSFPGNDQGWGRLNVARSLLNTTNRKIWAEDQKYPLTTGTAKNYLINLTASAELKVSLVWTDVNGTVNANRALVNDLDLMVTAPNGTSYLGNVFSGGYSAVNGSADYLNNVEMVRIASAPTGLWMVDVRGKNVPRFIQDYTLVVGGAFSNVSVARVDLEASNLTLFPEDPAEGELLTITGNITNLGDLSLPRINYWFRIVDEKNLSHIMEGERPAVLAPGELQAVCATWPAARGRYTIQLEVDPRMQIGEDREDNNLASRPVMVRGYGLELSAYPDTRSSKPGERADFSVVLHNRANTFDTFDLSVEGVPAGWSISVESPSLHVPFAVNQSFNASAVPPPDALAGDRAEFRVRAVSRGNTSYAAALGLTAVVDQVFRLELSAGSGEGWALPGGEAVYPIRLHNGGNGPDAVELALAGAPEGWQAYLSSIYLILQSGEYQNLSLTVAAPPNAPAFSSSNLTLACDSGGSAHRELHIVTRVAQVTALELQLADGPESVDPGDTAELVVKVQNLGNGPDAVNLSVRSGEGWSCEFSQPEPEIRAGDFSLDTLRLTASADEPAGEHFFTVRGVSGSDPGTEAELELSLFVNQVYGVELWAEKTREGAEIGNSTSFELTITNSGNGEDAFSLRAEDLPSRSWKVTVSPSTAKLPRHGNATVVVRVRPPSDVAEGSYTFNIVASSAGGPERTSSLHFRLDLARPPKPPLCTITSPVAGTRIGGSFNVRGTATVDKFPILRVDFRIDDGPWTPALGTDSWSADASARGLAAGPHRVQARAFDGTFFSEVSEVVFEVPVPPENPPGASLGGQWLFLLVILVLAGVGGGAYARSRRRRREEEERALAPRRPAPATGPARTAAPPVRTIASPPPPPPVRTGYSPRQGWESPEAFETVEMGGPYDANGYGAQLSPEWPAGEPEAGPAPAAPGLPDGAASSEPPESGPSPAEKGAATERTVDNDIDEILARLQSVSRK